MDNLHYEARATVSHEVEAAFNYAKEHNIKYYRAVSGGGAFFGWENGRHVKAKDGVEWFENPFYTEPKEEKEESPVVIAVSDEVPGIQTEPIIKYAPTLRETYEVLIGIQNELSSIKVLLNKMLAVVKEI